MNTFPGIRQRAMVVAFCAFVIALVIFSRAAAQAPRQAAGPAPAGNADQGKTTFASNCSVCHGDSGEGAMGPEIAGTALAFSDFTNQVRNPKGSMPAFDGASLPDAQVANIYAFLKSLKSAAPGASPDGAAPAGSPASDPAAAAFAPGAPGNANRGKTIFVSDGCYECHGRVGQGAAQTQAPRIGPPPIPVAAFAAYIRHPTGNMPPYAAKVVPDQDVADIYAFLQTIKAATPAKDIPLLNQ